LRRLREQLTQARRIVKNYQRGQLLVFSASQSAKAIIDAKMKVLDVNRAFLKSLGYKKREALGRHALDFVVEADKARAAKALSQALRGKDVLDVETGLIGKRGDRTFLFSPGVVPVRTEKGSRGYLISGMDITDRKHAEEALRRSEERLRLILEHSTDGISFMELDPATGKRRLVLCNDRFVEMSGRTRKELMTAREIDALEGPAPADAGIPQQEFVEHMLSGRPCRGTGSWIRPDGKENWIEWTAAPIKLGQKIYVIGIDRDITERRRAEEALRSANKLLVTAREEERRRLAGELHDSVSQGLVGLQLAIQAAIAAVRECLDSDRTRRLEAASDKCSELIREVRHICHGLYPPTLESLGLEAALRQLAGYCRDAQVEASVQCGVALSGARLSDDVEIALFRITQEAVSNSLRHGRARNIQLQVDYVAGEALLRIADDGVGFDSIGASSAGLGLSTMRERASAVGGQLKIESHPGRTCIEVRVPTLLRAGSSGATQGLANGQPVS
jgi:PAS domain S-box-containing protein